MLNSKGYSTSIWMRNSLDLMCDLWQASKWRQIRVIFLILSKSGFLGNRVSYAHSHGYSSDNSFSMITLWVETNINDIKKSDRKCITLTKRRDLCKVKCTTINGPKLKGQSRKPTDRLSRIFSRVVNIWKILKLSYSGNRIIPSSIIWRIRITKVSLILYSSPVSIIYYLPTPILQLGVLLIVIIV